MLTFINFNRKLSPSYDLLNIQSNIIVGYINQ